MKKSSKAEVTKRLQQAMAHSEMKEEDLAKIAGEENGTVVWAETQQDLADELEIDRRSVIRWSKEPGFPRKSKGRYNVPACRQWMSDNGKHSTLSSEPASPMKYELELRKLTAVCERLELEHKIKLGQYHLNTDCQLWVGKAMTAVRTLLLAIPSKMAPVLEMRPKEEIEPLLREAVDETLIAIHEKEWPSTRSSI
jgi:hypothetical protein